MKAVHHISRSLTQAEKNYSQIKREGLALIFAVRFHKILLTASHCLLFWYRKSVYQSYTANHLQRWALILLVYDFEIKYTYTRIRACRRIVPSH